MKLKELVALGQDLGLDEASLKEWLQTQLGDAKQDFVSVQDWTREMVKGKWESQERADKLFAYRTKAEAEIRKLEEMLELLRAPHRETVSLETSRGKAPQGISTEDVDVSTTKWNAVDEEQTQAGGCYLGETIPLFESEEEAPEREQVVAYKETSTERDAAVPKSHKLKEDGFHIEGDGPENQDPAAKLPRKCGSSRVGKTRSPKKRRIGWSRSSSSEDLPEAPGIASDNKDKEGTIGPPEGETSGKAALDGQRRKVGARSEQGGGDKDGVIQGKPAKVRAGGSKADSPASQPATHENGGRDPESCDGPSIVQPRVHLKARSEERTARANSSARAKPPREGPSLRKNNGFETQKTLSPSVRPTGRRKAALRKKTSKAKNGFSVRNRVIKPSGRGEKGPRRETAIKGNRSRSPRATRTQSRRACERDLGTKAAVEGADYAEFQRGAGATGHSKLSSTVRRPRLGG
ncbi:hypothetical protein ISCGN_013246 [Ixodes scapularis]